MGAVVESRVGWGERGRRGIGFGRRHGAIDWENEAVWPRVGCVVIR